MKESIKNRIWQIAGKFKPLLHSHRKFYFLIAFIATILWACEKKDPPLQPIDYSYLPLNIGHTVIYDVDSTVYSQEIPHTDNNAAGKQTWHYQVRETIDTVITDAQGRPALRVLRFTRNADTSQWTIQRAFSYTLTKTTAERYENNKRVVVLTFPPNTTSRWQGDAYSDNYDNSWIFQYTSVDVPQTYNNVVHLTADVLQDNDTLNKIMHTYSEERYAKNIGLVYKRFLKDSAQTIDSTKTFQQLIYGGTEITIKFNSVIN